MKSIDDLQSLPVAAQNYFIQQLRRNDSLREDPDFERLYQLKNPMGVTYAGLQIINNDLDDYEETIEIIDMQDSVAVGHGHVSYFSQNKTGFHNNRPYVRYTETDKKLFRQGLGKQRLKNMNELSFKVWHLLLHSAAMNSITRPQQEVWNSLVTEGLAEKYTMRYFGNELTRFRFVQ